MKQTKPIETDFGTLFGRDCIFLDEVKFKNGTNCLWLKGEVNGALCSKETELEFIPYEIEFSGILYMTTAELDTWDETSEYKYSSSFDEVCESEIIVKQAGKVSKDYKHYIFSTYDDVFSIICSSYKLKFMEKV